MSTISFWTVLPAVLVLAALFYLLSRVIAARYLERETAMTVVPADSYNRNQAANDSWRTVAQVVGGSAVVITFVWTMFQDRDNDARSRQQEANHLYIDASKLLSGGDPTERSAGIFALDLVARDRTGYAMPVRDLLVTLIAANVGGKPEENLGFDRDPPIDLSIQAALAVLGAGDRTKDDEGRQLDLSGTYLVGGIFKRSRGFSDTLFYRAKLFGADFSGATADRSRFDGASFNDYEAFGGWREPERGGWSEDTPFEKGVWTEWKRYRYVADFVGAKLRNATFTGAGLTGAIFDGADVSGADFRRANLSRASFKDAIGVRTANFREACWKGEIRDRPYFDPEAEVTFDPPTGHSSREVIYIQPCP